MFMIHRDPGWLDSWLKIIYVYIFVNLYGKNEWMIFLVAPVNWCRIGRAVDIWKLCIEGLIECANVKKIDL